jgi:hypothetical protein
MLTAHFIGSHAKDNLPTRIGWAATRLVQRGLYKAVTHSEAIHDIHSDGTVNIASASLRDGGVRRKRKVFLTFGNWLIIDVPQFDVTQSVEWFDKHEGQLYDLRGALATVLPGASLPSHWFCNEAVAASVGFKEPQLFGPAQWAAICMSLGTDITEDFFKVRA